MSEPWSQKPEFAAIVIGFPGGKVVTYRFKEPELKVQIERRFTRGELTFYDDLTEIPATYLIQILGQDMEHTDWGDWNNAHLPKEGPV